MKGFSPMAAGVVLLALIASGVRAHGSVGTETSPAAKKFLADAGEQVAIKKGAALRRYIDTEYEAMGKLAKALNLSPQ